MPKIFHIIFYSCALFLTSAQLSFSQADSSLSSKTIEELMQIDVISASKTTQSVIDAPAIITVITAEQIEEASFKSVSEALKTVVGIDIITDHFQPNIGIRGISSGMRSYSRVLKIMIDNQPIAFRSNADNYIHKGLFPMHLIERIEIIRGPNSVLYGADAYLGVINIITKNTADLKNLILELNGSSIKNNLSYGSDLSLSAKLKNIELLFSASYNHADRSGLSPVLTPYQSNYEYDSISNNDVCLTGNIYSKINYHNNKLGDLFIDFYYQNINTYNEFADWALLTHRNRINIYNSFIRGGYKKELSDKLDFKLLFAYSQGGTCGNDRFDINDETSDWTSRDIGFKGTDLKAEFTYKLNDENNFTIGFDNIVDKHIHQTFYYNTDVIKTQNPGTPNINIENTFSNNAFFMEVLLKPFNIFGSNKLPGLGLTGGIRFDMHNIYGNVFNYRAAMVYNLNEKSFTKILYGTSFKAPSSTQLYSNYIKTANIVGNPELKPETASTIDWIFGTELNDNFFISIDAFKNNIYDKVEFALPFLDNINMKAVNISEIVSYGFEAELKYNTKKISSYINYSYQKSTINKTVNNQEIYMDTDLYPSNMVKFGVNYKIVSWHLNLNVNGSYTDSRIGSLLNNKKILPVYYITDYQKYANNRYSLGGYFNFDFAISSDKLKVFGENETNLTLKVQNVFNDDFAYPGFNLFDIPNLGRVFTFSIKQEF